eukprot:2163307-Alexandrium_andersonii.AAC.1
MGTPPGLCSRAGGPMPRAGCSLQTLVARTRRAPCVAAAQSLRGSLPGLGSRACGSALFVW